MALKSETASPPDGMVINQESGGDDLEDGEIFDDEDDEMQTSALTAPAQTPAPAPVGNTVVEEKKVVPRKPLPPRPRRPKRLREDDRPFRASKQRRRSDEGGEKSKDKVRDNLTEDEDMREMSPLRGDWDRVHHRSGGFGEDIDDDDDDLDGGRRVNRGFNRRRGGRNARGGRRGMNNRRDGGQICRFYLQGKCQRGNDCPYSHASRKFELCKFYMMDCCAKKERCPFLHSEFPCKYYHLGMKCFAGKKCKFSHGKISSQLKANLLRDSKEDSFMDSSPSKDDDRRRDGERRERRHREREHREKERRKTRERKSSKDDDKYTLHFKVDPRTISEDEEGQQTPMPSPMRDNSSDRELRSPKAEVKLEIVSPKSEVQLPDPKDSGIGEELPDFIPADLPKHQRELYKRIQQQQREATSLEDGNDTEEEEEEKEQEDFKDEDWYSSEEEDSGKKIEPITAILNKLKQQPAQNLSPPVQQTAPPAPIIVPPVVLPDIDINAVSKLLSTVRETIQQKQNSENLSKGVAAAATVPTVATSTPSLNLNPLPPLAALVGETQPPPEKRRMRDPRLRGGEDDVDLRRQDVDLRQLPFKPAPIQPPANEIDASITTHPPLPFHLVPISPPPPPDYSYLPKNANDPRLRRYISGGVMTGPPVIVPPVGGAVMGIRPPLTSRDPRQARILPNDPRRKKVDSDLRQTFNHVDIDLRLQPHLAFK